MNRAAIPPACLIAVDEGAPRACEAPRGSSTATGTRLIFNMSGYKRRLPGVLVLVTLCCAASAAAQDSIDEILKKPGALSNQDRATLEAEIPIRIRRVFGEGGPSAKPAEARDRLVKPAKVKGVNPATIEIYAGLISASLESKVSDDDYEIAINAAIVLEELESAATLDGLIAALRSKHNGVRFTAARAISRIRQKLKSDESAAKKAIAALGDTGEKEADTHILRRIYACLNFSNVPGDADLDDAVASALSRILASRVRQIRAGQRDTLRDEEAIATAQACYKAAKPARQADLMRHLLVLLEVTAMRYIDVDTAPESLAAIGRVAQKMERAIHEGIKEAKATPPGRSVSDLLKANVSDKSRQVQDVRNAMEELRKVLRGEPWKIT